MLFSHEPFHEEKEFKNICPSVFVYALITPLCLQFDDDFYEFRCSIKELERRLGAVVSLAFDDCATVYGRFKLLDSFEGLLERPIIQVNLGITICLHGCAELHHMEVLLRRSITSKVFVNHAHIRVHISD